MNGQISQIPGLSPVVIIPPEEKTERRRGIVKESDSEYIKLAKQGGHKGRASIDTTPYVTVKSHFACVDLCSFLHWWWTGLLWHEDTVTPSVTQYKPPDWFIPTPVADSSPRYLSQGFCLFVCLSWSTIAFRQFLIIKKKHSKFFKYYKIKAAV